VGSATFLCRNVGTIGRRIVRNVAARRKHGKVASLAGFAPQAVGVSRGPVSRNAQENVILITAPPCRGPRRAASRTPE
jgi:hypothetical protein